jgi:hypothetical protein
LKKYKLDCSIQISEDWILDDKVNSHIYLICENIDILISIFYNRGEYYWVGEDDTGQAKYFGDFARAINK